MSDVANQFLNGAEEVDGVFLFFCCRTPLGLACWEGGGHKPKKKKSESSGVEILQISSSPRGA
jgi:hypothetical protein